MGSQDVNLGDPLGNDAVVYRAFLVKGFRNRDKNKVRRKAFYRTRDHKDGLSVGTTPEHAVANLATNEGFCELAVAPVHALPHDLLIRHDLQQEGHALITNLPFLDGTDKEREMAEVIAGKLTRIARIVTCNCFPVPPPRDLPAAIP